MNYVICTHCVCVCIYNNKHRFLLICSRFEGNIPIEFDKQKSQELDMLPITEKFSLSLGYYFGET